ncbi:MAG: serine hydrolase domain-containing protein [Pseudomonadota bacterium]
MLELKIMKILKYLIILTAALTGIVFSIGEKDSIDSYSGIDISTAKIDAFLDDRMSTMDIPGLSIAIINDSQVVYHRVKGFADKENKLAVTKQTIFEIASISKPVFAYFVMTFVEQGKLDLDKPLYQYMPYADIAYDERYKKITARMVLSHRTGFPNWREDAKDDKLKIMFEPNSQYSYSGEGYQYLALVLKHIEHADWKGLERLFQKQVAQPLGLVHTVFIQTPYTRKHKAQPYDQDGHLIDWENDYWYKKGDGIILAAATVHSDPLDFAKWMIAVMKKKGLKPSSYNELFKLHSLIEENAIYKVYYTLGLVKPEIPLTDIFLHGGNNQGFTSYMALSPSKKWGYIVMTNSEYGEQLGMELLTFLAAGPIGIKLYLIGLLILLFLSSLVLYVIKLIVKKIRSN